MFDVGALAARLIGAYDAATMLPPITADLAEFDIAAGYDVLFEIERRRRAQGWIPVGRKIGFTNRTIWPRYGVYDPMWAHMWGHTVHHANAGQATLALGDFVQPRIEPEVVFGLAAPVADSEDARRILANIQWIAPGFEIVQSHFPDWKFKAPDCTAAFGLHGALVVGSRVALTDANRAAFAAALPMFELTLRRGDEVIDRGLGNHVLGSPAFALGHLARVLRTQPQIPMLSAGEIVTTGTLTDAWPVASGETWESDYGTLGLEGLRLHFL
jgi:2-oxo-3-hexenedioate decarboxylase